MGDLAFLKFQPYRQVTLAVQKNLKLAAKYYGPFRVIQKIGQVAYKLQLPDGCKIHPVFHISLLKKRVGQGNVVITEPPIVSDDGQLKLEPIAVLDRRIVERNNQAVTQVLISWANLDEEESTWEDYHAIVAQFPVVRSLNQNHP